MGMDHIGNASTNLFVTGLLPSIFSMTLYGTFKPGDATKFEKTLPNS